MTCWSQNNSYINPSIGICQYPILGHQYFLSQYKFPSNYSSQLSLFSSLFKCQPCLTTLLVKMWLHIHVERAHIISLILINAETLHIPMISDWYCHPWWGSHIWSAEVGWHHCYPIFIIIKIINTIPFTIGSRLFQSTPFKSS